EVATQQLWTPALATSFGFDGATDGVFSGDGQYLISSSNDIVRIWELASEPAVVALKPKIESAVRALAVTGDSTRMLIAVARNDGSVTVDQHDTSLSVRD